MIVLSGFAGYSLAKPDNNVLNLEEAIEKQESTNHDKVEAEKEYLLQKEIIRKKIHSMNGNGYRMVHIMIEDVKEINDELEIYQAYADVIMEKEDVYDWLRLVVLLQDGQVISIERVPIPYYDRLSNNEYWLVGESFSQSIRQVINSLKSDDRSYFGIDKRSFHFGNNGIEDIQVNKIKPLASNREHTEVLVSVNLNVVAYGKQVSSEYWLYLRHYENKKWQIEDIQHVGGTAS